MTIKQVITAASTFDKNVARTMAENAIAFGNTVWDTFGDEAISDKDMESILDGIESESTWKGSASAGARRSEWKAAINAVPYYFVEACEYFKRTHPVGFNRVAMFKLARILPTSEDFKSAVERVVREAKAKKKSSKGGGRTIAQVVKSLFAIQTRKKNEIAFRKKLAELCEEHGIDYA